MSAPTTDVTAVTAVPVRALRPRARAAERGQVTLLFAGAVVLFSLIGVLVLDLGLVYEQRLKAQAAADFAALAGVQELPGNPALAVQRARDYLAANGFDPADPTVSATVDAPYGGQASQIHVSVAREMPLLLGQALGFPTANVGASGVAGAKLTDVVVVLDRSGSMCEDSHGLMLNCPNPPTNPNYWAPFRDVQASAISFSGIFDPALDTMGLVSYASTPQLNLALGGNFGPGSTFATAVMSLVPAGYTNIGGGIESARQELTVRGRAGAQRVIVLLTDGVPNRYPSGYACGGNHTAVHASHTWSSGTSASAGKCYAEDQARGAHAGGVLLYTIGLGSAVDGTWLAQLATLGGGEYRLAPSGAELDATFREVASLFRIGLLQ